MITLLVVLRVHWRYCQFCGHYFLYRWMMFSHNNQTVWSRGSSDSLPQRHLCKRYAYGVLCYITVWLVLHSLETRKHWFLSGANCAINSSAGLKWMGLPFTAKLHKYAYDKICMGSVGKVLLFLCHFQNLYPSLTLDYYCFSLFFCLGLFET
jgi:hypothetical protein